MGTTRYSVFETILFHFYTAFDLPHKQVLRLTKGRRAMYKGAGDRGGSVAGTGAQLVFMAAAMDTEELQNI